MPRTASVSTGIDLSSCYLLVGLRVGLLRFLLRNSRLMGSRTRTWSSSCLGLAFRCLRLGLSPEAARATLSGRILFSLPAVPQETAESGRRWYGGDSPHLGGQVCVQADPFWRGGAFAAHLKVQEQARSTKTVNPPAGQPTVCWREDRRLVHALLLVQGMRARIANDWVVDRSLQLKVWLKARAQCTV